jgi:hypothetical protein
MIFGLIDGASENREIILWVIENLSIPLDRARRAVLGPGRWANRRWNYSNPLLTSPTYIYIYAPKNSLKKISNFFSKCLRSYPR